MNSFQFGFLMPKLFLVKGLFSKFKIGKFLEQSENVLEKFKNFLCMENSEGKTLEWLDNFELNKNYQFENREFLIPDFELQNLCQQRQGYNFCVKSELDEVPTYILKQKWGINLLESFKIDRKPKDPINEADSHLKMIPTQENLDTDNETPPKEETGKIEDQDHVSAWHEVFTRTVQHVRNVTEAVSKLSEEKNEPKIKFSILPEPPCSKADVTMVRSTDDLGRLTALKNILESENFIYQHSPQARIIVHEFVGGPIKSRNSQDFEFKKKVSKTSEGNGSL